VCFFVFSAYGRKSKPPALQVAWIALPEYGGTRLFLNALPKNRQRMKQPR